MYYIFKLSDNWSVVEEKTNKSRVLEKNQVEVLNSIFQKLTNQPGLLMALEVKIVPPNKLMKLSVQAPIAVNTKPGDTLSNTT